MILAGIVESMLMSVAGEKVPFSEILTSWKQSGMRERKSPSTF
jgi:hypothetical protein